MKKNVQIYFFDLFITNLQNLFFAAYFDFGRKLMEFSAHGFVDLFTCFTKINKTKIIILQFSSFQ